MPYHGIARSVQCCEDGRFEQQPSETFHDIALFTKKIGLSHNYGMVRSRLLQWFRKPLGRVLLTVNELSSHMNIRWVEVLWKEDFLVWNNARENPKVVDFIIRVVQIFWTHPVWQPLDVSLATVDTKRAGVVFFNRKKNRRSNLLSWLNKLTIKKPSKVNLVINR